MAGAMVFCFMALLVMASLASSEVEELTGEPDFRYVKLHWRYHKPPNTRPSDKHPIFAIHYCEDQVWGRYRCKRLMLDQREAKQMNRGNSEYQEFEAVLKGLRMATNYSVQVTPVLTHDPAVTSTVTPVTSTVTPEPGSSLAIRTKGFSARATQCLANSSVVEVETGPNFGGKISVEGSENPQCATQGSRQSAQTKYILNINHETCGSVVHNTSVTTFIIVQENLPILTHSTRRFMVKCNYIPETFTVRAGVNLPDEANSLDDDLSLVDQDVFEVDPSELFDSSNTLFSSRLSQDVGRALKMSARQSNKEPRMWAHLVLMVILVLAAVLGLSCAAWHFIRHARQQNRQGFMSPQEEPRAVQECSPMESVVRDFGNVEATDECVEPPVALTLPVDPLDDLYDLSPIFDDTPQLISNYQLSNDHTDHLTTYDHYLINQDIHLINDDLLSNYHDDHLSIHDDHLSNYELHLCKQDLHLSNQNLHLSNDDLLSNDNDHLSNYHDNLSNDNDHLSNYELHLSKQNLHLSNEDLLSNDNDHLSNYDDLLSKYNDHISNYDHHLSNEDLLSNDDLLSNPEHLENDHHLSNKNYSSSSHLEKDPLHLYDQNTHLKHLKDPNDPLSERFEPSSEAFEPLSEPNKPLRNLRGNFEKFGYLEKPSPLSPPPSFSSSPSPPPLPPRSFPPPPLPPRSSYSLPPPLPSSHPPPPPSFTDEYCSEDEMSLDYSETEDDESSRAPSPTQSPNRGHLRMASLTHAPPYDFADSCMRTCTPLSRRVGSLPHLSDLRETHIPMPISNGPISLSSVPIAGRATPIQFHRVPISGRNTPISHCAVPISRCMTPIAVLESPIMPIATTPIVHCATPIPYSVTPIPVCTTPISRCTTPIQVPNTPIAFSDSPIMPFPPTPIQFLDSPIVPISTTPIPVHAAPIPRCTTPISHCATPIAFIDPPIIPMSTTPIPVHAAPIPRSTTPIRRSTTPISHCATPIAFIDPPIIPIPTTPIPVHTTSIQFPNTPIPLSTTPIPHCATPIPSRPRSRHPSLDTNWKLGDGEGQIFPAFSQ